MDGQRKKIIRLATVPISLNLLLKGQLRRIAQRYEVVAVSSPGEMLDEVERREGVRTEAVSMKRRMAPFHDLVSLCKLIGLILREKPWMVHSITPKAGLLGMMAAWICRVPVRVHMFTGLVFPTATGIKQKILITTDRLTCRLATHVLPEGAGVKRDLERYGITKKPLNIIGYGNISGIDLCHYDRTEEVMQAARKWSVEGKTTFCFVGRLVGDKGIRELVGAFERLYQEQPSVRLLLVGPTEKKLDPIPEETMQTILSHPGIEWLGWQEDIRPALAASDVFVLPSYREGFPNVVLQAGAMGLPCIVTDINGSNEIIEDGVNGRIVPPREVEGLFIAMKALCHNESRKELAQQARPRIAERYEQQALWKALMEWYQGLENE